jgi:hypothetical protein
MARKQTLGVALVLAAAAIAGALALRNTLELGQASGTGASSARLVAKRTAQLDRFEASLRRQLAEKPPLLPAAHAAPAPARAAVRRVVYVRPAPIVVHTHRAGSEREAESGEDGEGGDD